ncbi:hypothetical protein [Acidovorax sp. NCPPB 3576]|uniref:hypothetical protein n=1 Tax=Acidovorax sp. NCPPB 3576 TaxID=2940488 RepID=UPI00234B8D2C|nr:hypothetical protein [Acidovorax sp. NCPPB 3576]WCM89563.1 hypothetical protein M5C98_05825 [Acidovorax sp. NCPPB 3576]
MTRLAKSLHAPATRHVVSRSRWLGCFIAAALLAGLCGFAAWVMGSAGSPLVRSVVFVALWGSAAGLAWRFWFRLPQGTLDWDGLHWSLIQGSGMPVAGELVVHTDFQSFLLVQLHAIDGRTAWLCLERMGREDGWAALRRAVYSRPKPEPRADGMFLCPAR